MWVPINWQALRQYEDGARYFKAEEILHLCSIYPFVCLAVKKTNSLNCKYVPGSIYYMLS